MKNWAGNLSFKPKQVLAPASTQEAQDIVKEHLYKRQGIRVRGSAHSWTPLIETNDSFLHLDSMQGIRNIDKNNQLINVYAGTKLSRFGDEAFKQGLALPNQGDIDKQSLAGAISTGTHGTGIELQSISNQAQSFTIILGTGDILKIEKEKDFNLFQAAGVSLGALGLITEMTIKAIPAYKLDVQIWSEDMSTCLSKLDSRIKENRHFEIFYFPVGDWCLAKKMNKTEKKKSFFSSAQKVNERVVENWLYEGIHYLAHKNKAYKTLDNFVRKCASTKHFVNWSHKAFAAERTIRFMEMEYNLPIEKFDEVFAEMKSVIKKNNFETLFPIEIRFVKADNLWLSPAYKRDSVYFAVHSYIKEDFRPYFNAMEAIFKRHGGRPHWGKWHSMNRAEFENAYPKFNDFIQIRQQYDPTGLWLNPYLKNCII